MSQRTEPSDSLDDFPTPPWATRALFEHVLSENKQSFEKQICLEPACGVGHMAKVLSEYFRNVVSSDVHNYGFGSQADFLNTDHPKGCCDWLITNPPFRLAEEFVLQSLRIANEGVAILARTVFIESVGRYENLFRRNPPSIYAQFSERVPMVKGRLDKRATTATSYCWLIWNASHSTRSPNLVWIPPCRKLLERKSDYDPPSSTIQKILSSTDIVGERNAYTNDFRQTPVDGGRRRVTVDRASISLFPP